MKPKVVISRCLGFDSCRYNGATIKDNFVDIIREYAKCITVCPEVEIGLGVPRKPIRIVKKAKRTLVQPATGKDFTSDMVQFTDGFLDGLKDIDGFILKFGSPSCGLGAVKIYNEEGRPYAKTEGFFGGAVRQRYRIVPVEDEGRLKSFSIRHNYLLRLYASAGIREAVKNGTLDRFFRVNTLLLSSFNADPDMIEKSISDPILFRRRFMEAISDIPPCTMNIDIMERSIAGFKNRLKAKELEVFNQLKRDYSEGKVCLSALIGLVKAWAVRFDDDILEQTFFSPYPEELILSDDSSGVGDSCAPKKS